MLERFCRYVQVETTAVEQTEQYPSSAGQLELARMLAEELRAIGVADASVDEFGIVMGTVPGNVDAPTIAWIAHVDTSPEYTAHDVKPQIHRNYDGNDIPLAGDPSKVIRVADAPELKGLVGKTLITTDGTTLLGADDKAGVAIIMTAAAELIRRGDDVRHGPVRVVFTCDEEVGRGCEKIDIGKIDAVCAYTLDGDSAGKIAAETFSADGAVVTIQGTNIHPGMATGRMVNAIRIASEFVARLPQQTLSPEMTADRDGFIHPYAIEGGVAETRIRLILRSFDNAELTQQAELLESIAETLRAAYPRSTIQVDVRNQYRNMREALEREPRAVALAEQAFRNIGLEPVFEIVRGGTDGSKLSEMGLPTPNLSAGMHNIHSPLEFACLEEMETAVQMLLELAKLWGAEKR